MNQKQQDERKRRRRKSWLRTARKKKKTTIYSVTQYIQREPPIEGNGTKKSKDDEWTETK